MKLKITFISSLVIAFFVFLSLNNQAVSYSGGGFSSGYTGSPADNANCVSCHSGSAATDTTGWITSDVPVNGYVPGNTYTITATASDNSSSKFGFLISPQDLGGNILGTLSASSETQLLMNDSYVAHTSNSTSGVDSKTWTFSWIAPTQGTGDVTFYGAFNATNSNNATSGDAIYKSTLTIGEDITTSVSEHDEKIIDGLNFSYQNQGIFEVSFSTLQSGVVEILISNIQGRTVFNNKKSVISGNNFHQINTIVAPGVYVLKLSLNSFISTKKIIVQ